MWIRVHLLQDHPAPTCFLWASGLALLTSYFKNSLARDCRTLWMAKETSPRTMPPLPPLVEGPTFSPPQAPAIQPPPYSILSTASTLSALIWLASCSLLDACSSAPTFLLSSDFRNLWLWNDILYAGVYFWKSIKSIQTSQPLLFSITEMCWNI